MKEGRIDRNRGKEGLEKAERIDNRKKKKYDEMRNKCGVKGR